MPFRLRTVAEEFEAHLAPPEGGAPGATGKAERKRYANGDRRLKVRARGLVVPDGAVAHVDVAGCHAARAPVRGGRVSIDLETPHAVVPPVAAGQLVGVTVGGRVLLRGSFRSE